MDGSYSQDFVRDMGASLGDHYRRWVPFCKRATLAAVAELAASFQVELGLDPRHCDQNVLKAAGVEPVRDYLTRSGKYLRPYLVCLCMEAYGRDPEELPRQVALAEIIHTSSLVLDDIVDDSSFRRGAPTAHQTHGMEVAGGCGSAWLSLGFELVWRDRPALGDERCERLLREMSWEHCVTGLGTAVDLAWSCLGSYAPTAEQYLQQVVHRSASYTYRLPLKIGGVSARAPDEDIARLAMFGEHLGLAFQLVDDVLNVRPRDPRWGKELAEDITQGKYTLQVIVTLARASEDERRRLIEILESGTRDRSALRESVAIIEETGALDYCLALAERQVDNARACVGGLQIAREYRERLDEFAEYVVRRHR